LPAAVAVLRHPRLWLVLLLTYLGLFTFTGGLAFFAHDRGVSPDLGRTLSGIEDADLRSALLQMAQDEEDEHQKRADLAIHSFNVVLGALLGFLSASATGLGLAGMGAGGPDGGGERPGGKGTPAAKR
jgi:hypothetical protein